LCITPFPCTAHYLCITPFPCIFSYASYIKALYCIVLFTSIYRDYSINLTWYQSHCSKCFVQSSSFLAFFRCLNHLRYCSATAVRIPVCPLPSKVEQSPKTHCLRWNFLSRIPIETPPPPLERSLEDDLSRAKITAIRRTPPRADQSSCPPSRHVTRPTRLAPSCDATSALDTSALTPRQRPLTTVDCHVIH
jgi:hypothetical protein